MTERGSEQRIPEIAMMVWPGCLVGSGVNTNPARTFGRAVVSGNWKAWWIYWVASLGGALVSIMIFSFLKEKIEEVKLYHFECDQPDLASDSGN